MTKKLNIHIYPSTLSNESRIEKEVMSLIKLKIVDQIIVLGYNDGNLERETTFSESIKFIRINTLLSKSQLSFLRHLLFLEFSIRAFFFIFRAKVKIINCHSIHVLPIGILLRFLKKTKVIYDAHELETEVSGSKGIKKIFAKRVERFCIKYVDYTIVVNESIKQWYIKTYNIKKIDVIRNIPINNCTFNSKTDIFRSTFNIPEGDLVFIYQGLLSATRGVNIVIEAFEKNENSNKHIIFLGFGPLEGVIKELSITKKLIHFMPKVSPAEVPKYTSSADIGIHMILNTCLNHYYCLPNKLFEYYLNGLPVIVSGFPELEKIVKDNDIGWLIEPSVEGLLSVINNIDSSAILKKRDNIKRTNRKFDWIIEEKKYVSVYSSLSI
jgi:glycosyltransferase involved in cell wall biosynthesis